MIKFKSNETIIISNIYYKHWIQTPFHLFFLQLFKQVKIIK